MRELPSLPPVIEFDVTGLAMKTTVVVLVDKLGDSLGHTLESLKKQAVLELGIVVVLRKSDPEQAREIEARYPEITFLPESRDPGAGAALNRGIAAAPPAPFLAVVRDGVQLRYDCLIRLVRGLLTLPAGIALPRIMDADSPGRVDNVGFAITRGFRASPLFRGAVPSHHFLRSRYVPAGCGACLLFRRDLLDQVGGFEEAYLHCWEDYELLLRAWRSGYRCLYVPDAAAYRAVGPCLDPWSEKMVYYQSRGALATAVKLLAWRELFLGLPALLAGRVSNLLRYSLGLRLGSAMRGELAGIWLALRMISKRRELPDAERRFPVSKALRKSEILLDGTEGYLFPP